MIRPKCTSEYHPHHLMQQQDGKWLTTNELAQPSDKTAWPCKFLQQSLLHCASAPHLSRLFFGSEPYLETNLQAPIHITPS